MVIRFSLVLPPLYKSDRCFDPYQYTTNEHLRMMTHLQDKPMIMLHLYHGTISPRFLKIDTETDNQNVYISYPEHNKKTTTFV